MQTKTNPEKCECTLTQDETEKVISIIKSHFIPEEILFRIRPELKQSYLTRKQKYPELENDKKTIIKIPKTKMNEEERFLEAFLSLPNLLDDIPSLFSYLTLIMNKLNNPSDKITVDKILEITIANYYASKIKLYSEDANDSEDEDQKNKKSKEDNTSTPLTEEEIQQSITELQSHPLFMTNIPENPEDNAHLQALQSLKYEGNADEVAIEFYDKSNESFNNYKKNKNFKDLKEAMYDICNAIDHVNNDKSCDYIKFKLYYHRAQMNILVKNWRYAIEDLINGIKYISFIKEKNEHQINDAYIQLIEAYIQLEQFKNALNIINARKKELNEKEIVKKYLQKEEKIAYLKQKLLDDLSKIEMFKNLENSKKITLYEELTSKGIKLKPQIHNIPSGYQSEIYKDEYNKHHFPILVTYEEFNMTDYIQDFAEDRLIEELIEIIFENGELPWDKEHRYNKSNCLCYYQFSNFDPVIKYETVMYYPIRMDETLLSILTNKKLHMNGFPIVSIVSPMSQKFYEHFIKNKNIIKRKNK